MMIERKTTSKSARSVLFEEFNEIDIYVEDSALGYKKIYKEILNKAFDQTLRIEHILPIGSREEVIQECKNNQESGGRKRVYIVDGDLHILSLHNTVQLSGLFILPRYCIENYLVNKDPLIRILYEDDPELEIEEIEEKLAFEEWIKENAKYLLEMFILYSLCHKYCPHVQTVGFKVTKLCSGPTGIVCPEKTMSRSQDLIEILDKEIGPKKRITEFDNIKQRLKSETEVAYKYISGKDYLLPLLLARIKNSIRSSSDALNLKLRLAIHSEIRELKEIQNHVIV